MLKYLQQLGLRAKFSPKIYFSTSVPPSFLAAYKVTQICMYLPKITAATPTLLVGNVYDFYFRMVKHLSYQVLPYIYQKLTWSEAQRGRSAVSHLTQALAHLQPKLSVRPAQSVSLQPWRQGQGRKGSSAVLSMIHK